MSRYEYPRMSRSDIVSFLTETQIVPNISEHQLADPRHDFVCDIYSRLLTHVCSFKEDDVMDFESLSVLENPEFHVESTRKMNLYRRVKEVISSLECPKNFNLKDILKPTADRTEIFISAIINFYLYKDSKMAEIEPIVNELNILDEKQHEWGEKISLLEDEIERHNEARESERPLVQELESKVSELKLTISELNERQMSLRTDHNKLKEDSAEMDEKLSNAEYNLIQAVQENANLRSQVVQSPDKLQRALEEKKSLRDEAVQAEKLAKQAFAEKNTMFEIYTKAFKKMTKHYTQMEKIQEQINTAKSIDKDVKLLKAKLTDQGVMNKQLDAKLLELNGRVDQLEEQKKTAYNERQVKIEEATRTLDIVKQEIESRKQDLETRQSNVAAMVAEAEANSLKTNEVKESSKAKQQFLLSKMEELANAVQEYNGSFRTAVQNREKSCISLQMDSLCNSLVRF